MFPGSRRTLPLTAPPPFGFALRGCLIGSSGVLILVSLYAGLVLAPGADPELFKAPFAQRIFYVHVPSAWVAYLGFGITFAASLLFLRTGRESWDTLAKASAAVGLLFCTLAIVTGPIWAREEWGVYWRWEDTKLTLTFILFLIYLGYVTFRSGGEESPHDARSAAVIGILGFVAVPLSYISNRLWTSLHPAPVGPGGDLAPAMAVALLIAVIAFTFLFTALLVQRIEIFRLERRVGELRAAAGEPEA